MNAPPPGQRFSVMPGAFAVCRLAPAAEVPPWATGAFASVTRTADELSIVCPAGGVPADIRAERDWRVLKLAGPLAFTTVGVLAAVAGPLARAGISLLAVSTYETDYVLVKGDTVEQAVSALAAAGHSRIG